MPEGEDQVLPELQGIGGVVPPVCSAAAYPHLPRPPQGSSSAGNRETLLMLSPLPLIAGKDMVTVFKQCCTQFWAQLFSSCIS